MRVLRSLAVVLGVLCASTTIASDEVRRIQIVDSATPTTREARQHLKYLASCALDSGTALIGTDRDQSFSFPGGIGLAPDWTDRPMTRNERRWVSACILARTNAFGLPVRISMRTRFPVPSLNVTAAEVAQFPQHEAGFFGDIFSNDGGAYVCLPPQADERRALQKLQNRICAHDDGEGRQTTKCGFRIVGACPVDGKINWGDDVWREIIHVYLPAA